MAHAQFDKIIDIVEDRLPPPEKKKVQAHLDSGCPSCNETHRWAERVVDHMETDNTPDPPEWLARRSMILFRRSNALAQPVHRQRVLGHLVFDNYGAQTAGMRREGPAPVRSQLYRAAEFDIDLQMRRDDEDGSIRARGQVLVRSPSEASPGVRIELHDLDSLIGETESDEFGEFVLDDLPDGPFDLVICPGDERRLHLVGVDPMPAQKTA